MIGLFTVVALVISICLWWIPSLANWWTQCRNYKGPFDFALMHYLYSHILFRDNPTHRVHIMAANLALVATGCRPAYSHADPFLQPRSPDKWFQLARYLGLSVAFLQRNNTITVDPVPGAVVLFMHKSRQLNWGMGSLLGYVRPFPSSGQVEEKDYNIWAHWMLDMKMELWVERCHADDIPRLAAHLSKVQNLVHPDLKHRIDVRIKLDLDKEVELPSAVNEPGVYIQFTGFMDGTVARLGTTFSAQSTPPWINFRLDQGRWKSGW